MLSLLMRTRAWQSRYAVHIIWLVSGRVNIVTPGFRTLNNPMVPSREASAVCLGGLVRER